MNLFMHFSLTSPHKQESPPRRCHIRSVGIPYPYYCLTASAVGCNLQCSKIQGCVAKAQQLLYSGQWMKWYTTVLYIIVISDGTSKELMMLKISKTNEDMHGPYLFLPQAQTLERTIIINNLTGAIKSRRRFFRAGLVQYWPNYIRRRSVFFPVIFH